MIGMIERVARAITVSEGDDPDGKTGSLLNEVEVWWQHRIPQARAAIEAMREPTEAMINNDDLPYSPGEMIGYWHTMIDAALSHCP